MHLSVDFFLFIFLYVNPQTHDSYFCSFIRENVSGILVFFLFTFHRIPTHIYDLIFFDVFNPQIVRNKRVLGVELQRFRNEKNMSPVELKDKKPFSGLIFLYLFRFGQLHIEDQRLRLAAVQNSFILQIAQIIRKENTRRFGLE